MATAVGATCGIVLGDLLPPNPWTVGLAILVAMLASVALRTPAAAKVAGYISGIVVLNHGGDGWNYALARFVETVLGIAVAWLISLVPSLIRLEGESGGHDGSE
jgi:uncharacterized membrane protein YgaE (UPF0421/DUF939 family)